MKTIFKVSMLLVAGILLSQFAYAELLDAITIVDEEEVPFTIGKIALEGNGCPDGSATTVLSPDGNELAIMFSDFTAETGARPYDYANCNVAIPITADQGYTIGLVGVDYRGLALIPSGGMGRLSREYFFAGEHSDRITDNIPPRNMFDEFFFEDSFITDFGTVPWTDCGESTIARSNATIMVMAPPNSPMPAMMSVFSEDWDVSILLHLEHKRCN